MKEKFDLEKHALKQELDEMKVQLALGKADAETYLEEKKSDFSHFVNEMKRDVSKLSSPATDATKRLQGKLDHLKLQLALGRMESHDTYCAQRTKIVAAIDDIEEDLGVLEKKGQTGALNLRTSFSDRSQTFRLKLESAALSLGAGIMLTTHEVEDAVEKSNKWLDNLADMTLTEIQEARKYIKKRIATHSHKKQV